MAAVWATGNSLATGRSQRPGAAGNSLSGQVFGGATSTGVTAGSEALVGLAWSAAPTMPAARVWTAGCGVWGASVCAAGMDSSYVATQTTYLGSSGSWSTSGNVGATRNYHAMCGTQSAALLSGGLSGGSPVSTAYKFNGSTWSATGSLPATLYWHSTAGDSSAAWVAGGYVSGGGAANSTANFNGSTWSSGSNLPYTQALSAGFGSATAGVSATGNRISIPDAACYHYNGSTWAWGSSVLTARSEHCCGGEVMSGGKSYTTTTEIYGDSVPGAFTFTDAVDVQVSTLTTSNETTVTGITRTVSFSVSGGQAYLASTGWVTSGVVSPGDSMKLRGTSASTYSTQSTVTLTIGSGVKTFTMTTRNAPVPQIIFL